MQCQIQINGRYCLHQQNNHPPEHLTGPLSDSEGWVSWDNEGNGKVTNTDPRKRSAGESR